MTLVAPSAPRKEESGFGYLRRLASDNGLSLRDLTETAGVGRNRQQLIMRTDEVAKNLGLELTWVENAKQKEVLCRSWRALYRSQTDAVCSICLAESPHLRHSWEHAYSTACPRHQMQLVDRCNACGIGLSRERLHIESCSCGHDLRNLPRVPATRAQLWLSTLIFNDGFQIGNMTPILHGVDINVLAKVVQILCLHADPIQPKLQGIAPAPKSVSEAIQFLAPLDVLLAEWPAGFRQHVAQRIAIGRNNARTLNTLLGDWYIRLRKLAVGTALEQLVQVIIEVAAEKTDCVLGLDSAKTMAESTTGYVRSSEAAKAIGVSRSRLQDSILASECAHRIKRTGTRGQVYEVPCVEIERIKQRRANWISDTAVCEMARISPVVLDRMKEAEVIQSDVRWRENILKGGPVDHHSIVELLDKLNILAEPTTIVDDDTVKWAELTSRRMGEKQAIESLMKAILNGEVRAVSPAKHIGELSFRRSEVSQYFGMPLIEAGMSIQQLAKATNWKWESIAHWLNEGLLNSELVHRRGQPCHIVLPHQLLEFRQHYLPLADLARAMGTKSSALSRLLPRIKLIGAKRLPDGTMRGGLIRIADLGRLALIGARAGEDLFVPAEWNHKPDEEKHHSNLQ